MNQTLGMSHFHKRKRICQKHEPYPSKNKWKRFMDKAIYFIAVFGPLITIPQIIEIWINKNAQGNSIITWGGYLISAVFWTFYGVIHKEKPIVFMNILWIIIYSLIVVGIVLYG